MMILVPRGRTIIAFPIPTIFALLPVMVAIFLVHFYKV
jgi:hypothetical protein